MFMYPNGCLMFVDINKPYLRWHGLFKSEYGFIKGLAVFFLSFGFRRRFCWRFLLRRRLFLGIIFLGR